MELSHEAIDARCTGIDRRVRDRTLSQGTATTCWTFQQAYSTEETSQRLKDELLFQQGRQVYVWALPAMSGPKA